MADDPITVCEVCGEPVERMFYPVAVHFKGSGFYATDYGRARGGGDSSSNESSRDSSRTFSRRARRRQRRRPPLRRRTVLEAPGPRFLRLLGFVWLVRIIERIRREHEVRLTRVLCVAAAALVLGAGEARAERIGQSVTGPADRGAGRREPRRGFASPGGGLHPWQRDGRPRRHQAAACARCARGACGCGRSAPSTPTASSPARGRTHAGST